MGRKLDQLLMTTVRSYSSPHCAEALPAPIPYVERWLALPRSIISGTPLWLLCAGLAAGLGGCAGISGKYAGIDLNAPAPTAEAAEVQGLARNAQAGNKQAQLDLGIRFEQGLGVERDLSKAKELYRQAASDSGGTIWVYTPPVGNGTNGRVVPVNSGLKQKGIAEASRRLSAIK